MPVLADQLPHPFFGHLLVLETDRDARESLHQVGVIGRDHLSLGAFEPRVARREKQRALPFSAIEDQVGMRSLDAAEIIELVALAGHQKAVGLGRALDDGDGVIADAVEDDLPSGLEFLGREIGLVGRRRFREARHDGATAGSATERPATHRANIVGNSSRCRANVDCRLHQLDSSSLPVKTAERACPSGITLHLELALERRAHARAVGKLNR